MCCLCIQFTHENTSERTILHLVKKFVWLLALQKRLATPLKMISDDTDLKWKLIFSNMCTSFYFVNGTPYTTIRGVDRKVGGKIYEGT